MNALLWIFMPLLLAYASPLWWCVELWSLPEGYFAHGPLVPAVMAVVIWSKRQQWRATPPLVDRRGLWLLGPALLVHLCGAALSIDSLSAASLALAVPGAAWLAVGKARLRGMWPALWMVAFAVPLPIYLTDRIAFELKEIAVRGGVWAAQATGLLVERSGASLLVEGQAQTLEVADPCGGLRSLLAMVTLVYCVAFFMGPQTSWRRALLMVAAAPVAVFVNLVRIATICWLAKWAGVEFASGVGHDTLNAAAWILDLAIVMGFDVALTRSRAAASVPAAAALACPAASATVRTSASRVGAWLWPLCIALCFLSFTRASPAVTGRAAALPSTLPEFHQRSVWEVTPRMHQLLGTDDATWRTYEDKNGNALYVVAVFHGSNWKSVHPPHICLLGSDMDIAQEGGTDLATKAGDRAGQILLRTRKEGRAYVCLYAYGAQDLCTGSYLNFFLHHAPRALFRTSNDGFLLRVEAYADGPGGFDAAELRCRSLLENLIVEARRLLP